MAQATSLCLPGNDFDNVETLSCVAHDHAFERPWQKVVRAISTLYRQTFGSSDCRERFDVGPADPPTLTIIDEANDPMRRQDEERAGLFEHPVEARDASRKASHVANSKSEEGKAKGRPNQFLRNVDGNSDLRQDCLEDKGCQKHEGCDDKDM
jgi:hypothetical protein